MKDRECDTKHSLRQSKRVEKLREERERKESVSRRERERESGQQREKMYGFSNW